MDIHAWPAIYSCSSTGRTHLLLCLCNALLRTHRVLYCFPDVPACTVSQTLWALVTRAWGLGVGMYPLVTCD